MLKIQYQTLSACLAFATVAVSLLSTLPATATDFDSTVEEQELPSGRAVYRWEVTNSETGEVAAWGHTTSKRKAKKKAKEKEEELEDITSGDGVVVDDDFDCELLDAGNPECG